MYFYSTVIRWNSRTHILNDLNFSYFFPRLRSLGPHAYIFIFTLLYFPFLHFFFILCIFSSPRCAFTTPHRLRLWTGECLWMALQFSTEIQWGLLFGWGTQLCACVELRRMLGALVCAFQPKTAACRTRQLTVENSPRPTYRYLILRTVKQVEYLC